MLDLDQAGRLAEAQTVDLLEDGGGLLEATAVHVAPGQVGHLPVHPGHGGAHVGAQLLRGRRRVGVVEADESHSCVSLLKYKRVQRSPPPFLLFHDKFESSSSIK